MNARRNFLTGIFVLILAGAVYLLMPQGTESERASAEINAEKISKGEGFSEVLEKAKQDLELQTETILSLQATDGDYYDFSASNPEGGGIEILAYRNQKGSFEKVWEGQDHPDCFFVEQRQVYFDEPEERIYTVPISLVPRCFKTELKDRTTPIARLSSWIRSFSGKQ